MNSSNNLKHLFRFDLDICRKEADIVWTVSRYSDDTGKSDEQIVQVRYSMFH